MNEIDSSRMGVLNGLGIGLICSQALLNHAGEYTFDLGCCDLLRPYWRMGVFFNH